MVVDKRPIVPKVARNLAHHLGASLSNALSDLGRTERNSHIPFYFERATLPQINVVILSNSKITNEADLHDLRIEERLEQLYDNFGTLSIPITTHSCMRSEWLIHSTLDIS